MRIFSFDSKPTYSVGVEITSKEFHFTLLKQQGRKREWVDNGRIVLAKQPEPWQAVKRFCGAHCKNVSVGLEINNVLIKDFILDSTCTPREIESYLYQQAQNILSLAEDDLALDFNVRKKTKELNAVKMVATRKTLITELVKEAKLADLKINCINISLFSLKKLLIYLNKPLDLVSTVLINQEHLLYCVYEEQEIIFYQIFYLESSLFEEKLLANIFIILEQGKQLFINQFQKKPPHQIFFLGSINDVIAEKLKAKLSETIEWVNLENFFYSSQRLDFEELNSMVLSTSLALS